MSVILVTGATGRHGGTGAYVARRLRAEGAKVRLLARARDERSEKLEAEGFEVAIGDLQEPASLTAALEGVSQATFSYPVNSGVLSAAAAFSSAVRQVAPAARVVVMSMIVAHPQSPSHLGRAQWLAEEVMSWSGLSTCVLRVAAMFYENPSLAHAKSVREEGVMRSCFGDAAAPWIASDDAGELMVQALVRPNAFGGQRVCYPSGSALHTYEQLARMLSVELKRPVRYEPISVDQWRDELLGLAQRNDSAVNADMARHISALGAALVTRGAMKAPDPGALEALLGRPALTFQEFVRKRIDEFASTSQLAQAL